MSAGTKPESDPGASASLLPAEEPAPVGPADAGATRTWLARRSRHPSFWVAVVALVAVVGVSVWWFAIRSDSGSSTNTLSVTTTKQLVTVTRGTMSNTVSAEGTIAAAQTDNLSFSSAGTVNAVNVQAGDAVTAGQVLATIDSAQLQASVTSADATVASATAKLADDQAAGASAAQVAADETNLTSANDALAAAQRALDGASLVATFDGTVSQVNVTVGEQLGSSGTGGTSATGSGSGSGRSSSSIGSGGTSPGAGGGGGSNASGDNSGTSSSPQIQVVSKGHYSVSLPVSSSDIAGVAVGQSATLTLTTSSASTFPRFPGGFGGAGGAFGGNRDNAGAGRSASPAQGAGAAATGTVTDVAKVATASSGVAQYPVTVDFSADSNDFYIGATVTGAIATNVRQDVLQVPVRAVSVANGTSTVTVAEKGALSGPTETRTVKTGATANGMIEITDGLHEGESVVVVVRQFSANGNGSTPSGGSFPGGGNFSGRGRFPGGEGGGFAPGNASGAGR